MSLPEDAGAFAMAYRRTLRRTWSGPGRPPPRFCSATNSGVSPAPDAAAPRCLDSFQTRSRSRSDETSGSPGSLAQTLQACCRVDCRSRRRSGRLGQHSRRRSVVVIVLIVLESVALGALSGATRVAVPLLAATLVAVLAGALTGTVVPNRVGKELKTRSGICGSSLAMISSHDLGYFSVAL